jgi:uncharacterized protein (TIGR02270 family)
MPARVVPNVIREHAELAAFLWAQRDTLSEQDLPDPAVIAGLDRRVEVNLDGLRIAGPAAWRFVAEALEESPGKGELFLAATLSLEWGDWLHVGATLQVSRSSADDRGVPGALAWLSSKVTGRFVRHWLDAGDAYEQWLGASALLAHRADPGGRLSGLLASPDPRLRGTACRLAGRCGRQDAQPRLEVLLRDPDETVRFSAAQALAELGHAQGALPELKAAALAHGSGALAALRAVVRAGPDKEVRNWFRDLLGAPDTMGVAIRGAGMLGDRSLLLWLVRQMRVPALAPPSTAAFLELFPEARSMDDLRSQDAKVLGPGFADYFGEEMPLLAVADRVKAWSKSMGASG